MSNSNSDQLTEDNQDIDLRNGLADVIGLDWLRMFSSKELSTLVAGAEHEINVSDLQVCPLASHHRNSQHLLHVYTAEKYLLFLPHNS